MLVFLSCNKDEPIDENKLTLLSQVPVNIFETSGLAIFKDDQFLTISDSLNVVYLINTSGEILRTLEYEGKDTEGIAYDPLTNDLFIVEEKTNEVVQLDTNGIEINRFPVPLENEIKKHGLEGITYNPNNDHLYVVSEKYPSILFELTKSGEVIGSYELNFAEDYSSVFYDPHLDLLWILSDDSETLTKTTLQGVKIITYTTGIKKGEGVVVNSEANKVYVITDQDSSLYIFSF